jgi:hypothetical protein
MQNAILIGTCSLWNQPLGPMAFEVESGFGPPQGEEMQHVEIHLSVERGTGPKWAGAKEGDLSLHFSFLAPNALSHTLLNPRQMATNSAGASEQSLG